LLAGFLAIGFVVLLPKETGKLPTAAAPTPSVPVASTGATIPLTNPTASDVETITLYPGVTHVVYLIHHGDDHGWSIQGNYVTGATPLAVLQYYGDHFLKAGWVLDSVNGPTGISVESHDYFWTDRTKAVSWDLAFEVSVDQINPPAGTRVEVTLSRQPSLSRVPIYPNAQQQDSHWESSSTIRGFGKTFFSYLTNATPDQVNEYYVDALPQSGWAASTQRGDIRSNGIQYEWHTNGTKRQRGSYITVKATQTSTGKTQVQIVLASQIINH
jgi:hypothetical protein